MESAQVAFGTKAETLERLSNRLTRGHVPPFFYFTVEAWRKSEAQLVSQIQSKFNSLKLAVRSSACQEDGAHASMAGAFETLLNVGQEETNSIARAVNEVIASYPDKGRNKDQVLVQGMLQNVAVSGVITTCVIATGAPYYVFNYDDKSGKTDTVTGGIGVNKTVMIHRDAQESMISSERVAQWLSMVKELETLMGNSPLDIEFAQTQTGEVYLLQVRRIATERHWDPASRKKISTAQKHIQEYIVERSRRQPALLGSRTILGEMPDWNPAEMIGTAPRPLASSLYRKLITHEVWRNARGMMGYRNPAPEALMVMIGGRPFIDVRCSFNSFIPESLDRESGGIIIDAWLDRLHKKPELHDKVEFEIAHTVLDFTFDETFRERYSGILLSEQRDVYKEKLRTLTRRCIDLGPASSLQTAIKSARQLEASALSAGEQRGKKFDSQMDCLVQVNRLLSQCREFGTLPFAIAARHAFIAEALLRSAMSRGVFTSARIGEMKAGLDTVTSKMSRAVGEVCKGKMTSQAFLKIYGHLRPGTYDIASPRYDQMPDLFSVCTIPQNDGRVDFKITSTEEQGLEGLLAEAGMDVAAAVFMEYAQTAIRAREELKFIFSRTLSDAIEHLAGWGENEGLTREEMSYIPVHELLLQISVPIMEDVSVHFRRRIEEEKQNCNFSRSLMLSYVIRDERDIYVIPLHRTAPNFVTSKNIRGSIVFLSTSMSKMPELSGKIVCIENADPGFDWIFTRGIAGLITKFGGSNSHMAIRCAEFGLPAAIGCGEQTFEQAVAAGIVELNAGEKLLRPIHG